ncbi:MAG TPA: GGDEF domain-containing protein [Syntrophales bacterium]|nr:GGDEF domain-containing protein [Syntrophales bacterium]
MTSFFSLVNESARKTFLVFFGLSTILPLLLMTFIIYEYVIPMLIPEQINALMHVFTFGFAAMLSVCGLSFFLMSRRISSLETLSREIRGRSASILETNLQSVNDNEIETLRNAFDSLSCELVEKVLRLKQYSEEVIDHNRKLSSLAVIDGLTGLYNRRKLDMALVEECNRAERYNHALSFIMIDINDFKLYNDTHGHQNGDKILQNLGELLRKSTRKTDMPFRYGGDEFAILLPETGKVQAEEVSGKLIHAVSNHRFLDGGASAAEVTISCGVSSYSPHLGAGCLVKDADAALYRNKGNGRCAVSR